VLLSVAGLGYILNYSHIAGKLVPSGTTGLQRALTTVRQDRAQYLAVGTLPPVGPEMHRWGQNRWSGSPWCSVFWCGHSAVSRMCGRVPMMQ
jgi:hypothetical protein